MNLVPSGLTAEQVKKAQEGAQVLPAKPTGLPEYIGPVFKTTIKNASDEPVMLQTDSGGNWELISPGKEIVLCSWSPATMYAPFSRVSFEKHGRVSTTRRFNFKSPVESEPYSLLLDNRDGGPQEVIKVNDEYVSAIKGLPRRVAVPLNDLLIGYKAIVWKKKTIKEPAPSNRSYLITRQIVEKVLVPRKVAGLRAIRKEIEKQALADARQKVDQAFKRIQPVEGEDDAETESQAD